MSKESLTFTVIFTRNAQQRKVENERSVKHGEILTTISPIKVPLPVSPVEETTFPVIVFPETI
jgi:hypothetical protein